MSGLEMTNRPCTGDDNHFEAFAVGDVYRHARGKTVTENEAATLCHLVMNTADAHFNEHRMQGGWIGQAVVFGGVTIAIVIGLAMQDTGEQALAELALDNIRLKAPVKHGDTLYAFSEVLETRDADRPDAGIVRFRHYGVNQDSVVVFEGERTVLLRRKPSNTQQD